MTIASHSGLQGIKCISENCNATGVLRVEIDKAADATKHSSVPKRPEDMSERELHRKRQKDSKNAGRMAMKPKSGYEWNPFKKYPLNLHCYCGSGKKFKKCHANAIQQCVKSSDVKQIKAYVDKMIAYVSELKSEGIVYKTQQVENSKGSDEIEKDAKRT